MHNFLLKKIIKKKKSNYDISFYVSSKPNQHKKMNFT